MNEFLDKPSVNFASVRDGRRSMPLYYDVDLSVARSITSTGVNAPLLLNIAANSVYIDADTTNTGNAVIHFQDLALGNASAPMFVSPGFIANVPFTQLLIENLAQPGKRLRIFYGVDIDFQAGVNASIAIAGTVTVNNSLAQKLAVYDAGFDYVGSYKSNTTMAANTPDTIFAPGANTNGAIVWSYQGFWYSGANNPVGALIAKSVAPATVIDGDVIAVNESTISAGNFSSILKLQKPVKISAGKGLYYISTAGDVLYPLRACLYTLL
jgi:hypothetical protein